jgi:hypothetical protein
LAYDGTNYFVGNMDEVRISKVTRRTSDFELPLDEYSGTTSYRTYDYLGYYLPLSGFKEYIKTANTTAGTRRVEVWNGASWVSVTSLVDGTAVAGVPAKQTGTITFDDTASVAKLRLIEGVMLYWYRVSISDMDNNVEVYHITPRSKFQAITDIWDGILRTILSYQHHVGTSYYDFTTNVGEPGYSSLDEGTYVDISGFLTTSEVIIGVEDRSAGLNIDMVGSNVNTTANTIASVDYWNGSAWTTVGTIQDGTSENGKSLAKSGIISWNPPSQALEFKTEIVRGVPLYHYRLKFSQNISANTYIQYAASVPAPSNILGFSYPFMAQNRLFLVDEKNGYRNKARCSAPGSAVIFNGEESRDLYIGDSRRLTCGCNVYILLGSNFYDVILFFKVNEAYMVVDNNADNWTPIRLSSSVGCPAPATLRTASISLPDVPGAKKEVAIWQSNNGIYMYDGRGPIEVSQDISDWFDKKKSYSINQSKLGDSKGFFSREEGEYHWLFCSGTATTPNKEFVYDLKKNRWYNLDRGTGKRLLLGAEMRTHEGADYSYGVDPNGYVERLEHGVTFDGNDITVTLRTGDMAINEGKISADVHSRVVQLVHVAKTSTTNLVTCSVYADGESTPRSTQTFTATGSNSILKRPLSFDIGRACFISVLLSLVVQQDFGFEPLYLAEGFKDPKIWSEV